MCASFSCVLLVLQQKGPMVATVIGEAGTEALLQACTARFQSTRLRALKSRVFTFTQHRNQCSHWFLRPLQPPGGPPR